MLKVIRFNKQTRWSINLARVLAALKSFNNNLLFLIHVEVIFYSEVLKSWFRWGSFERLVPVIAHIYLPLVKFLRDLILVTRFGYVHRSIVNECMLLNFFMNQIRAELQILRHTMPRNSMKKFSLRQRMCMQAVHIYITKHTRKRPWYLFQIPINVVLLNVFFNFIHIVWVFRLIHHMQVFWGFLDHSQITLIGLVNDQLLNEVGLTWAVECLQIENWIMVLDICTLELHPFFSKSNLFTLPWPLIFGNPFLFTAN